MPTSERTARLCLELGVPLKSLDELPELDLTIDGADEVDDRLTLIKGGGGALLREKIVAAASKRMIVIADETKVVDMLGPSHCRSKSILSVMLPRASRLKSAAARLGLSGAAHAARQRRRRVFKPTADISSRCIFWPHS